MKEKSNKDIINYDTQGWPVYKMNIREILQSLGAKLENGNWIIPESDALDIYPLLVEDDGMGYGVNEQYITEINYQTEIQDKFCTIFRESKQDKIELWNEAKFYPNANVKIKGSGDIDLSDNEYISSFVRDINKTDDGFVYAVDTRKYRDTDKETLLVYNKFNTYNENELDWD